MPKKLPKEAIQAQIEGQIQLTPGEAKLHSLLPSKVGGSYDDQTPFVVLKYFRNAFECFSDWEKDELKQFSGFLEELRKRTWRQVLATSSKEGGKRGLAYTPYDTNHVDKSIREQFEAIRGQISEDIRFFELRVDQGKLRVHGFRSKAAFFLVLLDREHRVWPMK